MPILGATLGNEWAADGETGERIHVLHVDDDPGLLDIASTFLERENERFEVTTATDAATGLDVLGDVEIDCVVSDYDMPEMDGLAFLEAVRNRYPELPFLLFTGKGNEEIASEAISAGVTEYLQKGTGTDQYSVLANRIEQTVSRRRAEAELAETKRRQEVLLRNLPGMVYRCSTASGWPMHFVSEGCRDLVGYRPEALVEGRVCWEEDVIHPADRERTRGAVDEALETGAPFEVTYRIRTADDEQRWVWEQGQAVDDGENPILEGFITDVTDRKRRERQQRLARATFEAVADATDDFVVVVDCEDDAVVERNDAAAASPIDWAGTAPSAVFESGLDPLTEPGEVSLSISTTSEWRFEGVVVGIDADGGRSRRVLVGELE